MSSEPYPRVSIVGSMNIDYVTRVDELPSPGETIAADDLSTFRGGKGANQALSTRKQGCDVVFFGSVGNDENGSAYKEAMRMEGIDTTHILQVDEPTGSAFITVNSEGENFIVIAGGANDRLAPRHVRSGEESIRSSKALLCQFEVPLPAIIEAIRIANEHEVPVIVNPSPVDPTFPWGDVQVDFAIVNELEAADILEFPPSFEDPSLVRQILTEFRIEHLIVTRGSDGTLVFPHTSEPFLVETLPVLPIDTVGAGDAFAGCFTARIARGESVEDAVRAANCAGALTTLGNGAQLPIPDYDKVQRHLEQIPQITHQ